ncbi:MAG TPA: transketolase [Candidatus Nanoarchaeia archaeon]|nr:transketolase [Candidatus Nanoarchaeia archaeon]
MVNEKQLQDIANILRRDSLISTTAAGSGHPTSCLSCAEIISVLFFNEMAYDRINAFNPDNDELILSKGHATPILYSALYRGKFIIHHPDSLRKLKSPLEGHPIPSSHIPFIKVATGSLGQGLSIGVGMALAAKLQKRKFRTYVLLGDSEVAEGSVYEAMELAGYYKLNNLIAVVDVNRLGQRGETMLGYDINAYKKRFEGFGWNAISVNGHNINPLIKAFKEVRNSKKPVVIIAKTIKGKGVSFLEDKNGWHGKVLDKEQLEKALEEIPNPEMPKITIKRPEKVNVKIQKKKNPVINKYKIGNMIATREAYGNALAALAKADPKVLAVDGEVSNSTMSEKVKQTAPNQFIEAYIAEQNMAGMALGLSKKDYNVFASTFAAFLSRAHDQIRMAAVSKPSTITFSGSHAGVSIGKDGVSQMGLEDIAMFRSIPFSFVFYPSDAVSAEKLVHLAYKTTGLKYIRTTRSKTPVIYGNKEKFSLADFKILRKSDKDKVVISGAGITTHEALKAYDKLKQHGISVAVVDLYCIKPFNIKKFINFINKHGNKLIVAEDHYPEGGIGEMLSSYLANSKIKVNILAVNTIPHSGAEDELLEKYGIDWKAIVRAVKDLD